MLVWKYQSISKVMLVPVEEIYELGRIIKSLRSQLSQSLAQVFAMRTVSTETVISRVFLFAKVRKLKINRFDLSAT